MKRRQINTRWEQDQEIERLGQELQEIKAQNSRETWHRITWWIVIPICVIVAIVVLLVR